MAAQAAMLPSAKTVNGASLTLHAMGGAVMVDNATVTTADIAACLADKGFEIEKRKIHLDEPLKQLGEFSVPIRLHHDVTAQVKVVVSKLEE